MLAQRWEVNEPPTVASTAFRSPFMRTPPAMSSIGLPTEEGRADDRPRQYQTLFEVRRRIGDGPNDEGRNQLDAPISTSLGFTDARGHVIPYDAGNDDCPVDRVPDYPRSRRVPGRATHR